MYGFCYDVVAVYAFKQSIDQLCYQKQHRNNIESAKIS